MFTSFVLSVFFFFICLLTFLSSSLTAWTFATQCWLKIKVSIWSLYLLLLSFDFVWLCDKVTQWFSLLSTNYMVTAWSELIIFHQNGLLLYPINGNVSVWHLILSILASYSKKKRVFIFTIFYWMLSSLMIISKIPINGMNLVSYYC